MKKLFIICLCSIIFITLCSCNRTERIRYGYINTSGEWVIKDKYVATIGQENPRNFSEGLAVVKIKNKYGYIDKKGNLVIEPQFDIAYDFSEGLAAVAKNNEAGIPRWGYIKKNGEIFIELSLLEANSFSEGLAQIMILDINDEKPSKYIDKSKNVVIETSRVSGKFHEDLAYINIDKKYGFMDKSGKIVIEPKFKKVGDFYEGITKVLLDTEDGEKWGFINNKGEIIIQPEFDEVSDFSEGLAQVNIFGDKGFIDAKMGYINKEGEFVIEPNFQKRDTPDGKFVNGIAVVVKDYKAYFIDKESKILFSSPYDVAGNFSEGLAYARTNDKVGYIDTTGNFVFELGDKYMFFGEFSDGLAYVGRLN